MTGRFLPKLHIPVKDDVMRFKFYFAIFLMW